MMHGAKTVKIGKFEVGSAHFTVIAGPCSIENNRNFIDTADFLVQNRVPVLRGGIYKLRTSPDAFQGLGRDAQPLLIELKQKYPDLPIVSEITDPRQLEWMAEFVDALQVGTRNMYNYELLKELGNSQIPVVLKRAFSATVKEWLLASEYLIKNGNNNVILCERGIRSFNDVTRNTLDLGSVAYIKKNFQVPVIVDPSHAAGVRNLVEPLALASLAAGADGLLLETHPQPNKALSDADQALDFIEFKKLLEKIERLSLSLGRPLNYYEKSRTNSENVFINRPQVRPG